MCGYIVHSLNGCTLDGDGEVVVLKGQSLKNDHCLHTIEALKALCIHTDGTVHVYQEFTAFRVTVDTS